MIKWKEGDQDDAWFSKKWSGRKAGVKATVYESKDLSGRKTLGYYYMLQRGKDFQTADLYNSAWTGRMFSKLEAAQRSAEDAIDKGLPDPKGLHPASERKA